jgi:hypothetical protein
VIGYLKNLGLQFLLIFFVDYLTPGIDVIDQTKIPHIGGDLILSAGLGFLNSLISLVIKMLGRKMMLLRIAIISLALNFAIYALLKILPVGVFVTSVEGYLIAAGVVSLGSLLINFFHVRQNRKPPPQEGEFYHAPQEEDQFPMDHHPPEA